VGEVSARADIEDAVIALLKDMVRPGGVQTVRHYAGEMGVDTAEDVMAALGGAAPGILVTTDRGLYKGITVQRDRYRRDVEVVLYLVSVSQSTREARLRGPNQLYELADATVGRLTGVKPLPGEGCGHLEPVSEEVVAHTPVIAVWRQSWMVTVESELAEAPAADVTEVAGRVADEAEEEPEDEAAPIVRVSNLIT
jgi:hypothetical protein